MTELVVDWCNHAAAKYAVLHWHYSKRMPKSKLAKIGVWENDEFIGCVIFGVGATADLVKRFGVSKYEGCELVRIAINRHESTVSQIIALSIKKLRTQSPNLRLIVSFADPEQGHVGSIYQAGNWVYTGRTQASDEYIINGKRWHGRALRHEKPVHLTTKQALNKMDENWQLVKGSSKYRYLYPLDRAMRRQIQKLAQPYPKQISGGSVQGDTLTYQGREAGSSPAPRS